MGALRRSHLFNHPFERFIHSGSIVMATRREKLEKIMGESTPSHEKDSLLEEIFDDIGGDLAGFFAEVNGWFTGEHPLFKTIEGGARKTWRNVVENQVVQPLERLSPSDVNEIVEIVRTAEANGCKVRAVGSGHSFSDVVQTNDFLITTDLLNNPIELDGSLLRDGVDTSCLVHVENGIKIRTLNEYLDARGLALPNMGGYDAQSIVGAAATGTHGSGITLGPIASCFRSIVLVAAGGVKYRIEPTNGITDPVKYHAKYPENRLVQDDEWFNTVAVSMGCTGIIYSVIMEVMPKYWLQEVRTMSDWESVKALLRDGGALRDNRHFEVLVNPYPIKGRHDCLITRRNIVPEPSGHPSDKNERNFLTTLIAAIPGIVDVLDLVDNNFPDLSPKIITESMKALVDDEYTNVSYKVLNLGTPNDISAYSAEIGFPMAGDAYIGAVERMFEVADKLRRLGKLYHTSPISLRFVKASDAYLAMMNGRDTCMIEIPVINGTYGGFQLLAHYESAMYEFGGRPHWGQVNYLTGSNGLVARMYPEHGKWLNVYRRLNPNGTFDNAFTDRCGFSAIKFAGT